MKRGLFGVVFIFTLGAILSIATYLRASIVVVRPSIFPVLLGQGFGTPSAAPENFTRIVAEATRVLRADGVARLPAGIENIVVIEFDDHWLVCFFRKGNDRVASVENGKVGYNPRFHANYSAIRVEKGTLKASRSKAYYAHPWGPTIPLQFEVSYEDENPAEAAFNRPDSK